MPLYQDSIASELAFVLDHAEVSIVVAEDQEQVDKVLSSRASCRACASSSTRIRAAWAPTTTASSSPSPRWRTLGRAFAKDHPGYFEREMEQGGADDVALIAYTSGTTGRSKGALLSHGNMIATSESFAGVEPVSARRQLAVLPADGLGRRLDLLAQHVSLVAAATCNCPESPETVQRDLRELGPSALLGAAAHLGEHADGLQVKAADASWLKRRVYEYFRGARRAARAAEGATASRSRSTPGSATAWASIFVYGPVRDQLGLRNARWCLTGGAPLGADTFRFFRSFGVNLKQIYGATEASALVALQGDDEADPNTVGRTLPGTQVRIGERGEVQVKGPGVFVGYYKQDEATRDAVTPDGWLKTGDAGLHRPARPSRHHRSRQGRGQARRRHAVRAAIHREQAEIQPLHPRGGGVRRPAAVRGGDGRHRHEHRRQMGRAAAACPTPATWISPASPRWRASIIEEVAKINATLPEATQVRRIVLLNKELDADDAEMTRTRKVRRALRGGEVCAGDRGALRRRQGDAADHGHHLRGRPQEPAHLDHARPRRRPRRRRPPGSVSESDRCGCATMPSHDCHPGRSPAPRSVVPDRCRAFRLGHLPIGLGEVPG